MSDAETEKSVSWLVPTIWFIVFASAMGTNPFFFIVPPALDIWIYSILADIVFIGTMYASFRLPMEISCKQDELWKEVGAIYLTPVFVQIGFGLSWFTLINTLMFGIEPYSTNFEIVLMGYNGLWTTLVYSLFVRETMIGQWKNGKPDFTLHVIMFIGALLCIGFLSYCYNGFEL